ncbi:MAG: flagellar biosynthetic protein FliR [Pseudomonadales bacterium]|nr:flagellar biosynthetic protein FliR [Pseudomonadales bacterium]
MLEFSSEQAMYWLALFMWPFVRISGFMLVAPIFGAQTVPVRIRMSMAFMFALMVAPLLEGLPAMDLLSLATYLMIGKQMLIGLAMGFAMQLTFQVFILGGQMIAMQMGLGFASMMDPANGISVTVLSQFFLVTTMLLFVSMNGHTVMLQVFLESFIQIPIEHAAISSSQLWTLILSGSWLFSSALLIALPAVTAVLIVNFSFGVMTKAAPQLNVFALGFPIAMMFGLLIVWITLGDIVPQFQRITIEGLELMRALSPTHSGATP